MRRSVVTLVALGLLAFAGPESWAAPCTTRNEARGPRSEPPPADRLRAAGLPRRALGLVPRSTRPSRLCRYDRRRRSGLDLRRRRPARESRQSQRPARSASLPEADRQSGREVRWGQAQVSVRGLSRAEAETKARRQLDKLPAKCAAVATGARRERRRRARRRDHVSGRHRLARWRVRRRGGATRVSLRGAETTSTRSLPFHRRTRTSSSSSPTISAGTRPTRPTRSTGRPR